MFDDLLEDESLYLPEDEASYLLTEAILKPWTLMDILQNGIELDHFKVSTLYFARDLTLNDKSTVCRVLTHMYMYIGNEIIGTPVTFMFLGYKSFVTQDIAIFNVKKLMCFTINMLYAVVDISQ